MIRTIYTQEPKFPPTDQHPDAKRYYVVAGAVVDDPAGRRIDLVVDATTRPTLAEIVDARTPPAPSDQTRLERVTGMTIAEIKAVLGI